MSDEEKDMKSEEEEEEEESGRGELPPLPQQEESEEDEPIPPPPIRVKQVSSSSNNNNNKISKPSPLRKLSSEISEEEVNEMMATEQTKKKDDEEKKRKSLPSSTNGGMKRKSLPKLPLRLETSTDSDIPPPPAKKKDAAASPTTTLRTDLLLKMINEDGKSEGRRRTDSINSVGSSPEPGLDAEQRRGKVVLEIFETEKSYMMKLSQFFNVFYKSLESGVDNQAREFMSRPNLAGLCSNIQQIFHLSEQLLEELDAELISVGVSEEDRSSPQAAREAARCKIGPIFQRFSSLLSLYEQYVENHAFAREDINDFLSKPSFQVFWNACGDNAKNQSHQRNQKKHKKTALLDGQSISNFAGSPISFSTLDSYFIMPVQRVPRYVLLLNELQKTTSKLVAELSVTLNEGTKKSPMLTEDGEGRVGLLQGRKSNVAGKRLFYSTMQEEEKALDQAQKDVSIMAMRMNEAIRSSESWTQMRELQSKFVGSNVDLVGGADATLGRPRQLIYEGELIRVTQKSRTHKKFYFHLLSDMFIYSETAGNAQFKVHRVIQLSGYCKVERVLDKQDIFTHPSYLINEDGGGALVRRRSTLLKRQSTSSPPASSTSTFDSQKSRVFQVATTEKTLTVYAQSLEETKKWFDHIKRTLDELSLAKSSEGVSVTPLYADVIERKKCLLCDAPLSLLKIGITCKRCGLITCRACSNRKRLLSLSSNPSRVCDICRMEMDLTSVKDQPSRFRLCITVESISGLFSLAKGEDRKDPHSRCFFSLTQRASKGWNGQVKPGMKRGPSSLGHEASFVVPVGMLGERDGDSPFWILRINLLNSGEVGTIAIDVRDIMSNEAMIHTKRMVTKYKFAESGSDSKEEKAVTLSFELFHPPALFLSMGDVEKERKKEDKVPDKERTDSTWSNAESLSRMSSFDTSSKQLNEYITGEDVDERLDAFQTSDDIRDRTQWKLNVNLLSFYERCFMESPSLWGVVCVDYLYFESMLFLGMAEEVVDGLKLNKKIADDLLSKEERERIIYNRHVTFHHHPLVRRVEDDREKERKLGKDGKLDASKASSVVVKEEEKKKKEGSDARAVLLLDLLKTEEEYVKALEVLEEVFVTPLIRVSHGASAKNVRLSLENLSNVNANKDAADVLIKTNNLTVIQQLRTRDKQESENVANAVKKTEVTVMLQSIRQILTVNKQLLKDLQSRIQIPIDSNKCCIGDIFSRFAVVLKVYNSYATNHPSVEKTLTKRRGREKKEGKNDEDEHHTESNESLINFVSSLEKDERCRGRSLIQLLKLPNERINKYKRMLTALLMHTPDSHIDCIQLRGSLEMLNKSEQHISWSVKMRNNVLKLREIEQSFENLPKDLKLVDGRRWFECEGNLVKRCRKQDTIYRFWLFSDVLIYGTKSKKSNLFRYRRRLFLKDTVIERFKSCVERETQKDPPGDCKFCFQILSKEKSFLVMIPKLTYDGVFVSQDGFLLDDAKDMHTPTSSVTSPSHADKRKAVTASTLSEMNEGSTVFLVAEDKEKERLKEEWIYRINRLILEIEEQAEEQTIDNTRKIVATGKGRLWQEKALKERNEKVRQNAAVIWEPDFAARECGQCKRKFTVTFRRHHCRCCGMLVCGLCSKGRKVIENIHPIKKQRVCDACVKGNPGEELVDIEEGAEDLDSNDDSPNEFEDEQDSGMLSDKSE